ncbi:conserved protein of unknown function [Bradyrhizobium sp. ORS 285]|nr:conserved protein of unknown function [Bradyrhizobium sp. ORS 285]
MKPAFNVAKHVVVPESKNAITSSFDLLGASSVFFFPPIMLATIDFDYQFCFATDEVDDEGTNLRLTTEVRAGQLEVVAKMLPEDSLGVSGLGAHTLRERSSGVIHGVRSH